MVVTVVLDGPRRHCGERLGRVAAATLGVLLLAISVASCLPTFWLGFLLFGRLFADPGEDTLDFLPPMVRTYVWPLVLGGLAITIAARVAGGRLARGHRRSVLFLRRFGHTEATSAVTVAAATIGGSWRLVTLDDRKIAPIGVSPQITGLRKGLGQASVLGQRAFNLARGVFIGVAAVGAVGLASSAAVLALSTPGTAQQRLELLEDLVFQAGNGFVATVFQVSLDVLACCLAVLGAVAVVGFAYVALSPALAFFYTGAEQAITEAEETKAIEVPDEVALVRAREAVDVVSRRVLGARLVVLKVNSAIWQKTVTGFAATSAIALFDISHPTENVFWEISELMNRMAQRCVYIGQYDRVAHLSEPAPTDSVSGQLQAIIDGQQVLAYTTDRPGTRRFTRALRATLEDRVRTPLPVGLADPLPPELLAESDRLRQDAAREKRRRNRQVNWREIGQRVAAEYREERAKRRWWQ